MDFPDELERVASEAETFARPDERVTGILAAETLQHGRIYLCAYERPDGHAWLALDGAGAPVSSRDAVREAAQLAAMCEVAEEVAGGGELAALLDRLRELRETEAPEGIDEAEAAARKLAETIEPKPHLATTAYLDSLGAAARRLEQALGDGGGSPFAAAMQQALPAVEELAAEVERTYKGPLA